MLPAIKDDHPTLEAVQELFAAWRKQKTHRDPIPHALWEAARTLTDRHSVYFIARRLRLNYTNFKALTESRPAKRGSPFIELGPLGVTIEMTKPTGEKMTITGACDVGALARLFLE